MISLCLTVLCSIVYYTLNFLYNGQYGLLKVLVVSAITLILSYSILLYFINLFLIRRIRLIYKIIGESKQGDPTKDQEKKYLVNNLNEVEQDAQNWINNKNREIDSIRQMSNFRREYVGNVSHELKTPVFNMSSYLQTIMDSEDMAPEIKDKFILKIYKNAERLQEIIDDLSIVYKLESQERKPEMKEFDIKVLIDEIFEEHSALALQKNIKLQFNKESDNSFIVVADREYIRIALSNLINNAIKYGKYNGFVKVSVYNMDIYALIEVIDNGIGISDDHIPHVFERFYRVDKGRSREEGGSGLGLAIVKHILESHNQSLNIRSKIGVGTTVGFRLPLKD